MAASRTLNWQKFCLQDRSKSLHYTFSSVILKFFDMFIESLLWNSLWLDYSWLFCFYYVKLYAMIWFILFYCDVLSYCIIFCSLPYIVGNLLSDKQPLYTFSRIFKFSVLLSPRSGFVELAASEFLPGWGSCIPSAPAVDVCSLWKQKDLRLSFLQQQQIKEGQIWR